MLQGVPFRECLLQIMVPTQTRVFKLLRVSLSKLSLFLAGLATRFRLALQVVSQRVSPGTFRALTSVLRMANNAVGGFSFVTMARLTGVQAAGSKQEELQEAVGAAQT